MKPVALGIQASVLSWNHSILFSVPQLLTEDSIPTNEARLAWLKPGLSF
jgi:hypothetical protein